MFANASEIEMNFSEVGLCQWNLQMQVVDAVAFIVRLIRLIQENTLAARVFF